MRFRCKTTGKIIDWDATCINSALVSAQNRERLYWANFPISQPVDRGILLKDVVLPNTWPGIQCLSPKEREYMDRPVKGGRTHWDFAHHSDTENDKASACVANFFKGVPYNVLIDRTRDKCGFWTCDFWDDDSSCAECVECDNYQGSNIVPTSAIRKFHPIECERLQTLPNGYSEGVSATQRYKMIGNGWTVEVIKEIFQGMVL
jgi:site-specific DNA-cytosine methylase